MRAVFLGAVVVMTSALAAEPPQATPSPPPAADSTASAPPAASAATAVAPAPSPSAGEPSIERGCDSAEAAALPEGPVTLGSIEADLGSGRRVCPRTEVGFGTRLGAVIDTPRFYGDIGAGAVLFASWAQSPTTELFGTFEAVTFTFTQNATLKQTQLAMGHLTAGVTRQLYGSGAFTGAATARVLLPTSFEIPNNRLTGLELGHASRWAGASWLRVHTWLGADLTVGIGAGPAMPQLGFTASAGAELSPTSWFAFVLDVTGRAGALTSLWPTAALRFRIKQVGIDVGATVPVIGSDRHDVIAGLRLSLRL